MFNFQFSIFNFQFSIFNFILTFMFIFKLPCSRSGPSVIGIDRQAAAVGSLSGSLVVKQPQNFTQVVPRMRMSRRQTHGF